MTMITPSYLGETIEYSSLHACRSTLEDPTVRPPMVIAKYPSSAPPNGSCPITHSMNGDCGFEYVFSGQSTNFAKLKRNAAFNWYSEGWLACGDAKGTVTNNGARVTKNASVIRTKFRQCSVDPGTRLLRSLRRDLPCKFIMHTGPHSESPCKCRRKRVSQFAMNSRIGADRERRSHSTCASYAGSHQSVALALHESASGFASGVQESFTPS